MVDSDPVELNPGGLGATVGVGAGVATGAALAVGDGDSEGAIVIEGEVPVDADAEPTVVVGAPVVAEGAGCPDDGLTVGAGGTSVAQPASASARTRPANRRPVRPGSTTRGERDGVIAANDTRGIGPAADHSPDRHRPRIL